MDIELLHLYSPLTYHSGQYVVGNRAGLLRLREALDRALEEGVGSALAFVSDGEGFDLHVVCDDSEWDVWPHEPPYIDANLTFEESVHGNPCFTQEQTAAIRAGYQDVISTDQAES